MKHGALILNVELATWSLGLTDWSVELVTGSWNFNDRIETLYFGPGILNPEPGIGTSNLKLGASKFQGKT